MLILFYFMYILLNLENILLFSPLLFKCHIKILNIGGTVIETQYFIFLGVLWYREVSPFHH